MNRGLDILKQYAHGTSDVLKLAGGQSNIPPGFTSFWPGGGRWEGPNQVAAGENILGGRNWRYYDINNPQAPWVGLEGPRGSLGQWVDIPGENRRGRVIDVKQKGYGGYGVLQRAQYNRKGNPIPGTVGYGGGGGIGGGPFQGWTPEAMQEWHSGTPPSQMGYPSFTGSTAGPGGQQLAYETTSYNIPGYGWVPRAELANAQASTNPLDYLNPFGGTSRGGPGTGDPTQRAVGTAVGTLSNVIVPGLGFLTGPMARYVTKLIQGGASPGQIKQAVVEKQVAQGIPKGGAWRATAAPPPTGGGVDPYGNPTRGSEWYSPDFGRGLGPGAGGYNLAGPGGGFGQRGTGFGSGTVGNWHTAIGFGGNLGGSGPVFAGRYMGQAGLNRPFSEAQYMAGPTMKYGAPIFGAATQRPSYQQYLSMWNTPGSSGFGGGPRQRQPNLSRHMGQRQTFAQGDEDVMSLHRANFPVTEEDLKDLPDWLAKMLRNIPVRPPGGNEREQFQPRSVPVIQGPEGRFYDPRYSRDDERIMASMGTSDVNSGIKIFHKQLLRKKKP